MMVFNGVRWSLVTLLAITLGVAGLAPAGAQPHPPTSSGPLSGSGRITLEDLPSAQVPSLCGHPAGQLVDGHLPGLEYGDAWFTGKAAFGRIQPGAAPGAVAVMGCHQGGVGWPDNLVMYDAAGAVIGKVDLLKVTRSGRESVRAVRIAKGTIRAEVVGIKMSKNDCEACAYGAAVVWLRWSPQRERFLVVRKRFLTDRPAVVKTVQAVKDGRRAVALRHSSRSVVDQLFTIRRQRGRLSVGRCVSSSDPTFPDWANPGGRFSRMCFVFVKWPGGYESAYGVFTARKNWRTWQGRSLKGLAG